MIVRIALFALLTLSTSSATAESPRRLFENARRHYRGGEYGKALTDLRALETRTHDPIVLFDESKCLKRLERFWDAEWIAYRYVFAQRSGSAEAYRGLAWIAEIDRARLDWEDTHGQGLRDPFAVVSR